MIPSESSELGVGLITSEWCNELGVGVVNYELVCRIRSGCTEL